MKYSIPTKLFFAIFFLIGCSSAPKIIHTDYQYEKILFGNHRFTFDFHLENVDKSRRINNLINELVYNDRDFNEYVAFMEGEFVGDINEADYPTMIGEDGTENFYQSDFHESYSIININEAFIVFEYTLTYYRSGAAHGNYWVEYPVVDIFEERVLDLTDVINPVPDDLLKRLIVSNYQIDNFQRENIWPPDAINFYSENVELIWNTYTITPYAIGIIRIEMPDTIIGRYLTDKGRSLKRLIDRGR